MNSSSRAKRLSTHLEKEDMIVVENDSGGGQPVAKSAKIKAEPVPSPEVIELQQQLATLQQKLCRTQDNFESSFRIASAFEERAKEAEQQLLESTRDVKLEDELDELQSKLIEVTAQLQKSVRTESLTYNNNRELARQNEVLSAEVADLQRTIVQYTTEYLEMQEKMNFLAAQLDAEYIRNQEERARESQRFFEMTNQMAHYQQWEQWARQNELFRMEKPAAAADQPELQQQPRDQKLQHYPMTVEQHPTETVQPQQEQQQLLDPRLYRRATAPLLQPREQKQQQHPTEPVQPQQQLCDPNLQQSPVATETVQQLQLQQLDPRLHRRETVSQQQPGDQKLQHYPMTTETVQQPPQQQQQDPRLQPREPKLQHFPTATEPVQPYQHPKTTENLKQQQLQQLDPRLYRRVSGGKDQHIDQLAKPMAATPSSPPPEKTVKIYDIEHPFNILQLFRAGLVKSVGVDSAVRKLKDLANECGEEKLRLYLSECEDITFECEVCEKRLNKYYVLRHFFSLGHIENVRAHGGAVALAAYQYWFWLLQQAATAAPAAAPPMQHPAAAEQVAAAAALAAPAEQSMQQPVATAAPAAEEDDAPASPNWDGGSFIVIKEEDQWEE